MSEAEYKVIVIGAGTMGSGIAQLAAFHGCDVVLFDALQAPVERAKKVLSAMLEKLGARGKAGYENPGEILSRITFLSRNFSELQSHCQSANLIIEAVIEDFEIKCQLLSKIAEGIPEHVVIGSNTSSLSIAALSAAIPSPERFLGIHFFNPAPVLPLVEVIPGLVTASGVVESVVERLNSWGKSPVIASDTPGFIVNRVARPFYSEAIRIFEERIADVSTIDLAMKSVGGFRMGPFELMDFIGNDINFAVTESVFKEFFYESRFRPSITQKRYVEAGLLGKKSGRGYYDYTNGESPPPADTPVEDLELAEAVFKRIFCMLVNAATDALYLGIADQAGLDTAMKKGVNYPKGLLEWGEEFGLNNVLAVLQELYEEYGEERYRPHVLLKRLVAEGKEFSELEAR